MIPLLEVLYWHVANRQDYSKYLIHNISRRLNPAYSRVAAYCIASFAISWNMGFESANDIKRVTLKPQCRTHHLVAPLHVINSDFHLILLDVRLFQVSRYLKSTPSRLCSFFIVAVVLSQRKVKCILLGGV